MRAIIAAACAYEKRTKNNPSLTVKWVSFDVTALQSGEISHAGLMSADEAKCPSPPPKTFGIWSHSSALMEMGPPAPAEPRL